MSGTWAGAIQQLGPIRTADLMASRRPCHVVWASWQHGSPRVDTTYMAAHSYENKCPKEQGGPLIAFLPLTSEVLYCHFFLYLSKQSQSYPDSKGGNIGQSSGLEGCQDIFSPVVKPLTVREECPLSPLSWTLFLRPISKILQLPLKFLSLYKGLFPSQASLILFGTVDLLGSLMKSRNRSSVQCIK